MNGWLRGVGLGLVLVLAGALVPAGATAPAYGQPEDPTLGPLISGTEAYVDGAYVWTDYAYDDRGPDSDGQLGGNADYPDGMDPNNVSNLIQLQLRPVTDGLQITAVLQTLTPDTRPLLGVAFDTGAGTPAGALPGSWSPAAPLAMDRLFVLGVDGGRDLTAEESGWSQTSEFAVEVDTAANTLTATVPLPVADSGTLRSVAVAGYEHEGGSWLTGDEPIMDLAYVDDGWVSRNYLEAVLLDASGFITADSAYWQDGLQASVLAGDADPAPAIAEIDLGLVAAGATVLPELEPASFATFLYRSDLRLGEGVRGSGNSALYAGPYQPYLVRLPEELRPGLPLVMYLHGASQTHISPINTAHYDPEAVMPVVPLPDALFSLDAVVAWPLGRGPQQWYRGASEQDVLAVTDDVVDRLELDEDRVMLAGMSMGGMGAFRLGQLYPDRWNLVYSDVGTDQVNLLENLTNVPLRFQNGVLDPLVTAQQGQQSADRADAAETVDYASWILLAGSHQPAAALAECVYLNAFERPRATSPAQVRYTIDPSMFVDQADTGLQLAYDGAWWVSGMQAASSERGSVDLATRALGTELVAGETTSTYHSQLTGRDFCGPNPEVRGHQVWTEQAREVAETAIDPEPVLTGKLTGLSAVTIDAERAGLTRFDVARLELDSDEPIAMTLTGLAPGTAVHAPTATVRVGGTGTATVQLTDGASVVTLANRTRR